MALAPRRGGGGVGGSSSLSTRPEWVGVGSDNSALVADRADGQQSIIRLGATAQDHVNAYLEYERIVGDADGGVMMSEEEYAQFKGEQLSAALFHDRSFARV
jgi:hypothetical protein